MVAEGNEESPIVVVDVVLMTLLPTGLGVLLQVREREPFKGSPALPGGYIRIKEDRSAFDAAMRVSKEKLSFEPPYLSQLATYSGDSRDPRGWSLSTAYYALLPVESLEPKGPVGNFVDIRHLPRNLGFDHRKIVEDAVERVRNIGAYSSLLAHLAPERFTLTQLQQIYERVLLTSIDKVSFRRRMLELDAFEAVKGAVEKGSGHRPAQLYRIKEKLLGDVSVLSRGFGGR